MPRARSRIAVITGILSLVVAIVVGSTPAIAASTPTPTPSNSASAGSTAKKPGTVTFGLGTSNGKALDGRGTFSYDAGAGSVITDHVAIVNYSAQPLSLLLYSTDAVDSASGVLSYQPYTASHTGLSRFLYLPELNGSPIYQVRARSTEILPFQIRLPTNVEPGDHTAGIAVGLIAHVTGKSTKNLNFEQRVVIQVHIRVAGTAVAKLEITDLHATYNSTWNPFGAGSVTISYTVNNDGNVDLGAKQVVSVSGLFGDTGGKPRPTLLEIPDLLAGAAAKFTVTIPDTWPEFVLSGKVRITPVPLPNSVNPTLTAVSATTSIVAIPWALIILLIVLLVGSFFLRRYLKARAATRRKPSHSRGKGGAKVGAGGPAIGDQNA